LYNTNCLEFSLVVITCSSFKVDTMVAVTRMMYRLSEARKVLSVDSVSTCKC